MSAVAAATNQGSIVVVRGSWEPKAADALIAPDGAWHTLDLATYGVPMIARQHHFHSCPFRQRPRGNYAVTSRTRRSSDASY
jgi:hypothetical protein